MTHGFARRIKNPEGYAVKLSKPNGMVAWLADWDRQPDEPTTTYPAAARWFRTRREASDAARLLEMMTPLKWVVCTIPADARPCKCKADAQFAYPSTEPCPDCGNDHTAKVGEWLRCFKCGNAWQPEAHAPEDDGLTDEQVGWAARAAAETVFPELDDDALDAIEAEIRAEIKSVTGTFVP